MFGREGRIPVKLSSYYSPMLVVKCGCGSTVLSPVSADQFKRLFLMSHIKAVWSHHVDISSRNALCPGGQQLSLSVQSYLMKE